MRTNKKNFSSEELESLKLISDQELSIFRFEEIKSLSKLDSSKLQDILTIYTKKDIIYRIEKGLYCVRNFRNPYVIANAMVKDGAIAYWSALNLHGLTEQIPNVVYVQSAARKADKKVFNVRYKFIQVKAEKMCGILTSGYGNEQFRLTDVEKTLLDCFDLPQYSGGYEELIRAFYHAKLNGTKLLKYAVQMNNRSVIKRMGYLSELFGIKGLEKFTEKARTLVNERYSLLDPMGENQGKFDTRWRLRINLPEAKLLEITSKMY